MIYLFLLKIQSNIKGKHLNNLKIIPYPPTLTQ